jgi:hypothetical protein
MTFPCRFVDHLIDDHLDQVSLALLADSLAVHRYGLDAAAQVEPHRPAAVSDAGTVW